MGLTISLWDPPYVVVCLLMFWLRLSVASVASRLLGSLPHNDWTIHCDRGGPDTSVGPHFVFDFTGCTPVTVGVS